MECMGDIKKDYYFKSLDKVQRYPIVNYSVVYALSYYHWLKSTNAIIDNTLTKAESTLKSVKETAEPIAARKLRFIDEVVCNQLENLEKTCPLILESSRYIADISGKVYRDTFQTMMWPVMKTIDTVSRTSNIALSTVSSAMESSMTMVLPSKGLSVDTTNYVLDKTDELLNKILPNTDESIDKPLENVNVSSKVKRLSEKTKQRLYNRALKQIDLLQKLSIEKLEQIQSIIAEIRRKKESIQAVLIQETLDSVRDNFQKIPLKHLEVIKEVIHCSLSLIKSFSISSTLTMDYLLNNALNSCVILNNSMENLQQLLIKANPEFISDNTLCNINSAIIVIRAWVDLFINLFKMINLIGMKPLLTIIEYANEKNTKN